MIKEDLVKIENLCLEAIAEIGKNFLSSYYSILGGSVEDINFVECFSNATRTPDVE